VVEILDFQFLLVAWADCAKSTYGNYIKSIKKLVQSHDILTNSNV